MLEWRSKLAVINLGSIALIGVFVADRLQSYYRNWQVKKQHKEWERQYEKFLQQVRRRELHKREREKYPLFYWRELIEEKLEDGNF